MNEDKEQRPPSIPPEVGRVVKTVRMVPEEERPTYLHLHVQTSKARKNAYLRAANGRPLSLWMIEQLDKAANFPS